MRASLLVSGQSWFTQNRLKHDATDAFVAKDIVADILPRPLYLIELRLVVSQAVEGTLRPAQAKTQVDRLVAEYNARVAYWTEHPPGVLGAQHEAAQKFILPPCRRT